MHLVWHFSLLLMQKMLMSSQKVKGDKRTLKKGIILQHSWGKCETVFTFGEEKQEVKHWMWGLNNRTSLYQCKISLKTSREECQLEWKASTFFFSGQSSKYPILKRQNCPGKRKQNCMHDTYGAYHHMQSQVFQKGNPIVYYLEWSLILYIIVTEQ